MKTWRWTILSLFFLAGLSCALDTTLDDPGTTDGTPLDLVPPQFIGLSQTDGQSLKLICDEPVSIQGTEVTLTPDLEITSLESLSTGGLLIHLSGEQIPGQRYTLEALLEDSRGNTLSLITMFYGWNDNQPVIRFNEVTTRGSSTHPDCVELFVEEGGNMAGVTFIEGDQVEASQHFVFPEIWVEPGEYVVIHTKPQDIPEEITETDDPLASGGIDCSSAWDVWIPGGSGLSGNNGILSLYSNPAGIRLEGFLYSNRTSSSDEKYGGFGSTRLWKQADRLAKEGLWIIGESAIRPEDAVNPETSTATRSMSRSAGASRPSGKDQWHTTPTSGATWGTINTEEVYEP